MRAFTKLMGRDGKELNPEQMEPLGLRMNHNGPRLPTIRANGSLQYHGSSFTGSGAKK